jgi:DNA-binding CsgD family transcriptional regulator
VAHVVEAELLERERELEQIHNLIASAASGLGAVALIEGPAGIGKSSVLAAAQAAAEDADFEAARARASELEREFAFGLVRQLFEPRLARMGPKQRTRLFAGAAALAEPLFRADDLAPRSEASHAVLHGLYWLTANIAAETPLALVVDDVHWGDAPSLRFLAYLVNRVEELPIAIVLAARPFEPGAEMDLLDELATSPSTWVLRPTPLSRDAVAVLVRAELGEQPAGAFAAACLEATGGNPLLLHELLVTLSAEDLAPTAAEAGRVAAVAPRSVVRSVSRRLRRLSPEAGELAQTIAVLGDGADLAAAAALSGLDREDAADAAETLRRTDILKPGTLEFAHPLVRAAVYAELAPPVRAGRHRAAAAVLAERGVDEDAVALHLRATEPSGDRWVVEVLRRSARRAHARGAPDVAARYLERALAEPPPEPERADVLIDLGAAEIAALRGTGFGRLREAIELAGDPSARARIALRLGRSLLSWGDLEGAARVFWEALARLHDADPKLRAKLDAYFFTTAVATPSLAHGLRERLARLWEDPTQVSEPVMLVGLGASAAVLFEPAGRGAELAARALADSRLSIVDDPAMVSIAATALMTADRLVEAQRVWDRAVAEARRRGAPLALGVAWTMRAAVLVRQGALAAAEADARGAFEDVSRESAFFPITFVVSSLIDVLIERGELDEASRLIDRHQLNGELPDLIQMTYLLDSMGRLRVAQGRLDEGIAHLRECGRRLEELEVRNPGLVPWRANLAPALAAAGQPEEALALAHEEIELARAFEVPRELALALRAAALVQGGERSIDLLREAVAALDGSPAELDRARALTDLGAAMRRAGRRSAAREPLRSALDLAQRCGASVLAERAHGELVASGARPRRLYLRGVDALTASERRVAEMASEGLTNREIAQALFVTEKTVEGHLGNAYRKLGIHSRSELPGGLARRRRRAGVSS